MNKELKCVYVYFIVNDDDSFTRYDEKYTSVDFNDVLAFAKSRIIRNNIIYGIDFGVLIVDNVEYQVRINKNEDIEYSKHRVLWKVIR